MESAIKISTQEISDISVESILTILSGVNKYGFNSEVAVKALDVFGNSANQPISLSNVSIVGDTVINEKWKRKKQKRKKQKWMKNEKDIHKCNYS